MNKRFRRGTNNIAQYRVLRPNRTSPEMIMVLLNGDKTNVQTTTSHRHGAGERSSLYLALGRSVAPCAIKRATRCDILRTMAIPRSNAALNKNPSTKPPYTDFPAASTRLARCRRAIDQRQH
jgi:hypothetical protein